MQRTQKLTRVLRDLILLVEEEASKNAEFADRLEAITTELPKSSGKASSSEKRKRKLPPAPDVFSAFEQHGEAEFPFWLRSLDVATLKAIVKANGFDPGKSSQRWSDPDKFINMIAEQTISRLRRGSAFLPPKANDVSGNP